ncbi:MAG: type IV pilus biogenesis/stability protein PilW [Gammaproteobacteria bacterium]
MSRAETFRSARRRTVLAACLMAAGCVSTSSDESKVSDHDAARYNTQLGVSYLRRGDLEAARDKLEKAVDQDPDFASAHAALGILYERTRQLDDAGEHFATAVRLSPDDANLMNAYGGFLCRSGDRQKGLEFIERAADNAYYRTPEAALTNAGVCARGIPDLARAEQFFRRALARDALYAEALLQLADLKLAEGEPLSARAFLQRYESVAEPTATTLMLGRQIEKALGNEEEAADYARRLARTFPDSSEARSLAR